MFDIYRQQLLNDSALYEVYNKYLLKFEDCVLALSRKNLLEYGLPQLIRPNDIFENTEYLRKISYDVGALRETVSNGETSLPEKQNIIYQ